MKILNVPYAEKDQAKALGARWNKDRRAWYVPDGQSAAPFEQWLVTPPPGAASVADKVRIDTYAGEPVVGAHFLVLEHACDPFVECAPCAPLLARSGWQAAHRASLVLIEAIRSRR